MHQPNLEIGQAVQADAPPADPSPAAASADEFRAVLADTRNRTLELVGSLSEQQLTTVHSPLLSPLVWDLGHIAAFADLWISRSLGIGALHPELMGVYDADETPRARRGSLPMLGVEGALEYLEAVQARALELADQLDPARLELIIRHEHQHNETMLQCIQLGRLPNPFRGRDGLPATAGSSRVSGLDLVDVPGGTALIGAGPDGFAYDNERDRHEVALAPFRLGRSPVTNGDWQEFIADGGYQRREWWSAAGWEWRVAEQAQRPLAWHDEQRHWLMNELAAIDADAPVVHISYFEAEAFANAHGARLPSELEWEWAATCDPACGTQHRNPWGDEPATRELANVDHLSGRPLPAISFPDGASATRLHALIGDVWEWTASHFRAYPGFAAHPYREYSEQFFGDRYRVLRGGSWATRARVASATFRNWDLPQRRQIFSGLRLAADLR